MVRYPEKKDDNSHATIGFPAKWQLRNERRNSTLVTPSYPDLVSASDWLKQISHALRPIRSTTQIWIVSVVSTEYLRSFLRRHFAVKPLVASQDVVCFLRLMVRLHGRNRAYFSKISYLRVAEQTSSKFCPKMPFYFHLSVKSAMSTSIFLSAARKKPVQKAIFCGSMLVSNEETWLALLPWISENPSYLPL